MLQHLEPMLPFSVVMLVEPLLSPHGPEHLQELRQKLISIARERWNVWSSRQHAREHLRARVSSWDPRALDVYIVRSLPDSL